MKKVSKIDVVYIAGFFDGEGCVSGHMQLKCRLATTRISIGQQQVNILYWIQKTLGYGKVYRRRNRNSSTIVISSQSEVKQFIKLILPYSKVKKPQLLVGFQLADLIGAPGVKVNLKLREKRLKLYKKLKRLKNEQ